MAKATTDIQVGDKVKTVFGEELRVLEIKEAVATRGVEIVKKLNRDGKEYEAAVPKLRKDENDNLVMTTYYLAKSGDGLCWFPADRIEGGTE